MMIDLDKYFDNEHLNDEAIALFCDAMLLHKEEMLPASIRDHVESCAHCKREIIALYEIIKRDDVVQTAANHPFLDKSMTNENKVFLQSNLLKIAAVSLLFAGLGYLIYYVVNNQKNSGTTNLVTHTSDSLNNNIVKNQTAREQHSDSIALLKNDTLKNSSVKKNELAVNMKESVLFENLIASHYRSNGVEVVSPSLNHLFHPGQNIVFEINGDISEPFTLFIYNNRGKKIIEKNNILKNSLSINNRLPNGLYYWKLLRGDDLLQIGKFFVK